MKTRIVGESELDDNPTSFFFFVKSCSNGANVPGVASVGLLASRQSLPYKPSSVAFNTFTAFCNIQYNMNDFYGNTNH